MAGTQIATSVTILNSLLGYAAVSLTNFATSAETMVAAGSKLEVAGGFFTFSADEQPSGWVAIGTAATAYIACVPSGTAGSQVLTPEWTEDAPVWRDDLQGWYGSAASSSRYVGTVYKTSATQWDDARVLMALQGTTGPVMRAESVNTTGDVTVAGDAAIGGSASVTGTLGVTGVATLSGNTIIGGTLGVTSTITAGGALLPRSNPTEGTQEIASFGTWTVPRGVWMIDTPSEITVQIYVSSAWRGVADGAVFSDGTNVRAYNSDDFFARSLSYLRF